MQELAGLKGMSRLMSRLLDLLDLVAPLLRAALAQVLPVVTG